MNKPLTFSYGLAFLVALAVGYIDTHATTDDTFPAVLILLVCAFPFGFAQPRRVWPYALIVGLGVPAAHLIGLLFGYRPPYPVEPNVLATFLALIPAFIGAYSGALAGLAARGLIGEL